MATVIILPKIDEAMTKGKIVEWRKKEGDSVTKGEVVYVIETEKVTWEVEAPESGILRVIRYGVGEEVAVGETVAFILQEGEELPGRHIAPVPTEKESSQKAEARLVLPELPDGSPLGRRIRATPMAKRIAREYGLDLLSIRGSGPGGRITRKDLREAPGYGRKGGEPLPTLGSICGKEAEIPLSSMRETIARRMTQSFQSTPHFYLSLEVDAEKLCQAQQDLAGLMEKDLGVRITLTDLLIKIAARALEENPRINVQWAGKGIRRLEEINIGLAVALEDGLVVPVVRRANALTLPETARARADLAQRAQQGKIRMDEMRGGSMTITNLGMIGIDQFTPIINPPESCILAVGRVMEKPVAYQGQVAIRRRMNLTLAIDHRVLDGATGGLFLRRIQELVEEPSLRIWSDSSGNQDGRSEREK
jgi:pyruvate dehydrogenase E2 component (dihydrolipoamide acetyltransferase)